MGSSTEKAFYSPKVVLPTEANGYTVPLGVDINTVANDFVERLSKALTSASGSALRELMTEHGYWRDMLAFTRDMRCFTADRVASAGDDILPAAQVQNVAIVAQATELERNSAAMAWVRIHITFTTVPGKCSAVVRLVFNGEWRLWTLLTCIEELKGHTQMSGGFRPWGTHYNREPYDVRRERESEFQDRDPDVLIVGAGHNGLAMAAVLQSYGLKPLIVDKQERLGDNWRKRYASLSLHDIVWSNHLPFMPFPSTFPVFMPAGMLANWLEYYAGAMELNVWLKSSLDPARSHFNQEKNAWEVTVLRHTGDGLISERPLTVSHVIMATGLIGGKPKFPSPFPGQSKWEGKIVHSSQHPGGKPMNGEKVLVVGACTSAHDVSVDLVHNGADVTMLQRSPTFVKGMMSGFPILTGAAFYHEANLAIRSVEAIDRIFESFPNAVIREFGKYSVAHLAQVDRELLAGLKKVGFKTWGGPDGTGFMTLAQERGGGYYFSAGGSEMIISGQIKLKSGEIASFDSNSKIRFTDGDTREYDQVIFATGFSGFAETVAETLGSEAAAQLKPMWGLDSEGEIRGIGRPAGPPNVYFCVGNLWSTRSLSKLIAFQVLGQRNAVWGESYTGSQPALIQTNVG